MTESEKKYGDIMDKEWGSPAFYAKHPRMAPEQRAKVFAPFAALRGHAERIEDEHVRAARVPRTELSGGEKDALSRKLAQVRKGTEIALTLFEGDGWDGYTGEEMGYYRTVAGTVADVDALRQAIRIYTGEWGEKGRIVREIPFADIIRISGEGIGGNGRVRGIRIVG